MAPKKKFKDFETAIERLEEITDILEAGESSLEESIDLYSEGLEIAHFCDAMLSETEKKIKVIQEQDGLIKEAELDAADEEEED